MMVAWFLLVLVPWQEWPVMLGPYTVEECFWTQEYLDRRGYVESSCEVMIHPQKDAVRMEVPFIP